MSPARLAQLLHNCCSFHQHFVLACSAGRYAVIGCMLKQNANEGCNSCASLAGLVLCFIACFILLVIAPLAESRPGPTVWDVNKYYSEIRPATGVEEWPSVSALTMTSCVVSMARGQCESMPAAASWQQKHLLWAIGLQPVFGPGLLRGPV